MKNKLTFLIISTVILTISSCQTNQLSLIDENIDFASKQIGLQIDKIEASGKVLNPVTFRGDSVFYCSPSDWRSGFFPGTVWYLYQLSKNESLIPLATKYTEAISEAQYLTFHHDIGFIINCSFGNAMKITGDTTYRSVMLQAAKSLTTRFRPVAGVIQSWNVGKNDPRGWECPVIIDNMMNLELFFEVTKFTGDSTYYKMAMTHADRTLKEQFRPDGSCYHVIDYSMTDGSVRNRHTAQGYAHESSWSRGQAWSIYGYTICYRYTKEQRYLDQAVRSAQFMMNHKNMPSDGVAYWDMDAPNIPNEKRDASTAAIMASALYEMSTMPVENAGQYVAFADKILTSLSSPAYRAPLGKNGDFILMHSVGSIPHKAEVDAPLNYADYYFLEAILRKITLQEQ